MHYGCLGWQRGQKKFDIIVTVQFYFKFENVIFLVLLVQKIRNNFMKTIILKLTVMFITDWNIMYRVNRLNVVLGKTLICCNTLNNATVISFTIK